MSGIAVCFKVARLPLSDWPSPLLLLEESNSPASCSATLGVSSSWSHFVMAMYSLQSGLRLPHLGHLQSAHAHDHLNLQLPSNPALQVTPAGSVCRQAMRAVH